jgi:hypothetical protein
MVQRLVFATIAWAPIAAVIALSTSTRIDEVVQAALMAMTLILFALVPRLAYVLSVATLGLLIVGGVLVGALLLLGVRPPLGLGLTAAIGGAFALGYVATAGIVALGPSGLRPWARQPQPVRNR